MASKQAKDFYSSKAWQDCRAAYKKMARGLCERCLKKGLYVPGEIVHHKTYITPDNVTDPEILTDFKNLELLCRRCHAQEHADPGRRYLIDDLGRVITL